MARLFWLNDEAWAAIEPHLPKNQPRARRVDDCHSACKIGSDSYLMQLRSGLAIHEGDRHVERHFAVIAHSGRALGRAV